MAIASQEGKRIRRMATGHSETWMPADFLATSPKERETNMTPAEKRFLAFIFISYIGTLASLAALRIFAPALFQSMCPTFSGSYMHRHLTKNVCALSATQAAETLSLLQGTKRVLIIFSAGPLQSCDLSETTAPARQCPTRITGSGAASLSVRTRFIYGNPLSCVRAAFDPDETRGQGRWHRGPLSFSKGTTFL